MIKNLQKIITNFFQNILYKIFFTTNFIKKYLKIL